MEPYLSLAFLGVGMVAIVLAVLGKKAGLILAAADVVAGMAYPVLAMLGPRMITGAEVEPPSALAIGSAMAWPILWTAILVAIGFGFEPFLRRLGVGIYRLDRQVMMGAAIGMIVTLFVAPGMSMMVVGAFLGALAGGLFAGVQLQRAFKDALGSLLGLFGGDGIRLMCTISVVAQVIRISAG